MVLFPYISVLHQFRAGWETHGQTPSWGQPLAGISCGLRLLAGQIPLEGELLPSQLPTPFPLTEDVDSNETTAQLCIIW